MQSTDYTQVPVEELLVHRDSALLVDKLSAYGDNWAEAEVSHSEATLYSDEQGRTPSWVGIEYMAQTIGFVAGLESLEASESPKPGFLLGTRECQLFCDYFEARQTVVVRVDMTFRDEHNMAMFDCKILDENKQTLVSAEIKAIQPNNIEDVLNR